jgi:plasmid stabilization system protein ParE
MARVQITVRALADLERLFDFLAEHNPKLELLADHPLLGRQAEDGRRELILSRGRFGYVAKYRWVPAEDVILILAVRHQLEAGYKEE